MSPRNANIHGLRARDVLKTARRWLLCLEMFSPRIRCEIKPRYFNFK